MKPVLFPSNCGSSSTFRIRQQFLDLEEGIPYEHGCGVQMHETTGKLFSDHPIHRLHQLSIEMRRKGGGGIRLYSNHGSRRPQLVDDPDLRIEANSWGELQAAVIQLRRILSGATAHQERTFWYRGVSQSTYTLTPSLFRHSNGTLAERQLYESFNRLHVDTPISGGSSWERLINMQHYGIPSGDGLPGLASGGEVLGEGRMWIGTI